LKAGDLHNIWNLLEILLHDPENSAGFVFLHPYREEDDDDVEDDEFV